MPPNYALIFHEICRASAFEGIAVDPNLVADFTPDQLWLLCAKKDTLKNMRIGKFQKMSYEEAVSRGFIAAPGTLGEPQATAEGG